MKQQHFILSSAKPNSSFEVSQGAWTKNFAYENIYTHEHKAISNEMLPLLMIAELKIRSVCMDSNSSWCYISLDCHLQLAQHNNRTHQWCLCISLHRGSVGCCWHLVCYSGRFLLWYPDGCGWDVLFQKLILIWNMVGFLHGCQIQKNLGLHFR